jgi:hypothetical protein
MADTRHLKRRHETWFFTLAVPRDLRGNVGKERIVLSLKTRDLSEAQDARWAKLQEFRQEFARLRGKKPSAAEPLDPKALLDIDEFARASYHEALTKMEKDDWLCSQSEAKRSPRNSLFSRERTGNFCNFWPFFDASRREIHVAICGLRLKFPYLRTGKYFG